MDGLTRRELLGAALAGMALSQAAHAQPRRPQPAGGRLRRAQTGKTFSQVLLIMCDQWRYRQHWPAAPRIPLPAYQRLCQHGMEFTRCCIASAACTPSRATIFSGKYGRETGAQLTSGLHVVMGEKEAYVGASPDNPRCNLPRSVKTLGHYFQEAGIPAFYKGKWHLSHADGAWPKGAPEGLDAYGFQGWHPPEGHGKDAWRLGYGVDSSYIQDAVATLWDFKNRGLKEWLLVCSLINPHDIGAFPKWLPDIPDLGIPFPASFRDNLKSKPACQAEFRRIWADGTILARKLADGKLRRENRSPEQIWASYLQLYGHLTQIADAQVGIMLDALEQTDQLQDTLVVFLSDHGELGGAHGMMQKWYQAYEESLRVPLIFSNPAMFPRGKSTEAMASLIDLVPTLLSMVGVEPPGDLRGVDLSPVVRGEAASVQEDILFVSDDDIAAVSPYQAWTGPVSQPNRVRAVRNQRYKLCRYVDPDGKHEPAYELYDLQADPDEVTNLAGVAAHRALREQLDQRLTKLLAQKYEHPPLYPT